MKDAAEERSGGRGVLLMAVVLVLGGASIVAAVARNSRVWADAKALPEQQRQLEELAKVLAEYKSLKKFDLKPKDHSRFVRRLIDDIGRRLQMQQAIRTTKDIEIERTKQYVRMKYGVGLGDVTLDRLVRFLYEIQFSGRNLVPMEVSIKRNKDKDDWSGNVGIHGVSKLK